MRPKISYCCAIGFGSRFVDNDAHRMLYVGVICFCLLEYCTAVGMLWGLWRSLGNVSRATCMRSVDSSLLRVCLSLV